MKKKSGKIKSLKSISKFTANAVDVFLSDKI